MLIREHDDLHDNHGGGGFELLSRGTLLCRTDNVSGNIIGTNYLFSSSRDQNLVLKVIFLIMCSLEVLVDHEIR